MFPIFFYVPVTRFMLSICCTDVYKSKEVVHNTFITGLKTIPKVGSLGAFYHCSKILFLFPRSYGDMNNKTTTTTTTTTTINANLLSKDLEPIHILQQNLVSEFKKIFFFRIIAFDFSGRLIQCSLRFLGDFASATKVIFIHNPLSIMHLQIR